MASREDVSMLAIGRLAAHWWEEQPHPCELERPGRWFARHIVRSLLGSASHVKLLSDEHSEQTFAALISLAQTARREPTPCGAYADFALSSDGRKHGGGEA